MRRYTDRPPTLTFGHANTAAASVVRVKDREVKREPESPRGRDGAGDRAGVAGVGGSRPGPKRDSYWILERMWSAL